MMLNAGAIFDKDMVKFSNIAGTPKSADTFRRTYIEPLFADIRRENEGVDLDAAYGAVIADYQREGFIVGFNAAVQLLMGCAIGITERD